jgi:DNA-binding NtrC family response regulator
MWKGITLIGAVMVKHKILVVDDELFVRELLEEYFSKLDFEVLVAGSGPAALKLVAENRFKVALIDLKMSDMDGIEVLRRIRDLDENLIVILMTGYPTVESSVEAMRIGAYDYVIKPFRLNELKDIISRAIKEHQIRCELSRIKSRLSVMEQKLAGLTEDSAPADSREKKRGAAASATPEAYTRSYVVSEADLNIESQLERWGKLLKEGLITQREFEANKNRILSAV